MSRGLFILLALVFLGRQSFAVPRITNLEELRQTYRLADYDRVDMSKVVVAILEKGFGNNIPNDASLPRSQLVPFRNGQPLVPSEHGYVIAKTVADLSSANLLLLNANTLDNFKLALAHLETEMNKPENSENRYIVVHAQNFECCSDFRGSAEGPIKPLLTPVIEAGALWINAAGNYHRQVFNMAITRDSFGEDGYLRIPGSPDGLRLNSHLENNRAQIVLSWRDVEGGTDVDLTLEVFASGGEEPLFTSTEVQVQNVARADLGDNDTPFARDAIDEDRLVLEETKDNRPYLIRIKSKDRNKIRGNNFVRVTVIPKGEPILDTRTNRYVNPMTLVDATLDEETMTPADDRRVIAAADLGPYVSRSAHLSKPDVFLARSDVALNTRSAPWMGTSTAAAIFAAIVAKMLGHSPEMTKDQILGFARNQLNPGAQNPQNPVAFWEAQFSLWDEYMRTQPGPRPRNYWELDSARRRAQAELARIQTQTNNRFWITPRPSQLP